MFWKLIILALVAWALLFYFSLTLGGLIHLVPATALVFIVVRRMAKDPDTAFGRWKASGTHTYRR